jgi:hypothetical protein
VIPSNFEFRCLGEDKESLQKCLEICEFNGAEFYSIVEKRLSLHSYDFHDANSKPLPFELKGTEAVLEFIWSWLKQAPYPRKPDDIQKAAPDKEVPDSDSANETEKWFLLATYRKRLACEALETK